MSEEFKKTAAAIAASTAPGAGTAEPGPDRCSGDYELMRPLWEKVDAMEGGVDKMRNCPKYLPRFESEAEEDYLDRAKSTPFTNIYEDISGSLAGKPFSRSVVLEDLDEIDQRYKDFYDDVDGRGNNLHVYSENLFQDAIDRAIGWILIDYTALPPLPEGRTARSVDEETKLGARPYWVHISGPRVLAAYSDVVRGKEIFTHIRITEPTLVREGYTEEIKQRVRIFDRARFVAQDGVTDYEPATWRVEEKRKDEKGREYWAVVEGQQGSVSIEIIPMVPLLMGKRIGNGWAVKAPLAKLVDMQMDAFQQESNIRNVEMLTAFPMLVGEGVSAPVAPDPAQVAVGRGAELPRLRVGPRTVLYAPPNPNGGPNGSWKYIEPSAENLKALTAERDQTWGNMREIGMQPLAESNITVITSANVSVKAKSTLQAWAIRLEDALEQAMIVTAMWFKLDPEQAPAVDVFKDFGVDLQSGKELDTLVSMAGSGLLSGETVRKEAKRRDVLADDFDEEEEQERLANEAAQGAENEDPIDPVTGEDAGEPVDPGDFGSADEIDDGTLESLFGADAVANAGN